MIYPTWCSDGEGREGEGREGASFGFRPAVGHPPPGGNRESAMGTPTPGKGGAGPAPKPAILVVDDDPDVRLTTRWALEDAGLRVATATDGRDALA
jgi:hypothetical protein